MNKGLRNSNGNYLFRMYYLVNSALLRGDIETARHVLKDILRIHKEYNLQQSPVLQRLLNVAGMWKEIEYNLSEDEINYSSNSGDYSKKAEPFTEKELEEEYQLFLLSSERPENSLFLSDALCHDPYAYEYILKFLADETQIIRKRLEEILMELKKK